MEKRYRPLVLIIEDEKIDVKILTEKLVDNEYSVAVALGGRTGLELAICALPDLIVLDLILPVMHGFEVLERLKQNPDTKNIPVLILSNLGQDAEIKKGKKLGAVDYLVKANVDLKIIMDKINNIIKK